jgi:Flp pilus assembly protein TadB
VSRTRRNRHIHASQLFFIFAGFTILVWVLRGLGILTFIPGGIIWILILLSAIAGIWSRLQRE